MVRPSSVSRQNRHLSVPSARLATGCSQRSSETSSSTSSKVFAHTAQAEGDAFAAHSGQYRQPHGATSKNERLRAHFAHGSDDVSSAKNLTALSVFRCGVLWTFSSLC